MKQKIAYIIPSLYYPAGMERVLTLKANYLAEVYDYEIHIIITDGTNKEPYYKLSPLIFLHQLNINFEEIYKLPLPKRIISYTKKQKTYKKLLSKCLCTIRPDITISLLRRDINFINNIKDGSIKLGEIHLNKSNYRDFNNSNLPFFIQNIMKNIWMKQLINQLNKLTKFIVLSHEDKKEWTELKNVQVIHNPLSFYPEEYSTCENKQVIAVGRYMPQKGFDQLITAWQIVTKKHPDWTLRIYGDGMRKELQKQINELKIEGTCILEPTVSNIRDKYCESSIFILSSRFEGMPMVMGEAMACGLPAVSFTCPCGPRDIIEDGIDGILVENGNIKLLANKICYLIDNENIRKSMGEQARINIQRFKIENIAKQWDNLFKEILYS